MSHQERPNTSSLSRAFSSSPSRFSPLHPFPLSPALHLSVPSPLPGSIIRSQHAILALIRLAERIPSLFPHALHLPYFSYRFLELFHAWAIILDVVLLDFLHVVICLRAVHTLVVLPGEVAEESEEREEDGHDVEDRGSKHAGDDSVVFRRKADFRRHGTVDGDEGEPDDHRAGDGEEGVFGPDIRDQGCFAEHHAQNRGVE